MSFDLRRFTEREQETGVDPERVAQLRTKDAQLSDSLERDYVASQENWRATAEELNAFFHNAQFTEEQEAALKRRAQAAVPINVIFPAVEQAVSMLTTNKPSFQATAREDSDVKTARVVTDLMSYAWEQSDGNAHLKVACYDYYVKGRGVLQVFVDPNADYGRGEIRIAALDPFDVFPDPASRDRLWRDAAHIIVSRIYTREQIEAMWPDAEDKGILSFAGTGADNRSTVGAMALTQGQHLGPQPSSADAEEMKVIERYSKVKQRHFHVFDGTNNEEKALTGEEFGDYVNQPAIHLFQEGMREEVITDGEALKEALSIFEQAMPSSQGENVRTLDAPPQVDPQTGQEIPSPPIVITLLTIGQLIQDGLIQVREVLLDRIQLVITIGGYEYYNRILPIEHYPIVPLNNRHDRNPYPLSDVFFVRPMQQALNKINMQILSNLALANSNKLIVHRGSIDRRQVEEQMAIAAPTVIEVDFTEGEPKIFGPGAFPNGLFQHFQNLISMIERELGIFSLMQGDPSAAPDTYKGTLAMDEFGQRRIRSKLDDIETMLNQVGRVFVQFMPHVYSEQKVIRLVQPNNSVRESVANQMQYDDLGVAVGRINDITTGYYDVVVVSGSTLPSNRWALSEYLTQLYQLQLVDQVEVLKKTDVVDMEGVLERSSMISQLQNALMQAQEQIKQLEGELTSARTNEVTARKQLEVERFKSQIRDTESDLSAATQLFKARLQDTVRNEALMQRAESKSQSE